MTTSLIRTTSLLCALAVIPLLPLQATYAQEDYRSDLNGDGFSTVLTFGDSITFGVGDGTAVGEEVSEIPRTDGTLGYPERIARWGGVLVLNAGVPGEVFTAEGIQRFSNTVQTSNADVVALLEGANDAYLRVSSGTYERTLQKAINIIVALGKQPLLITLPTPTGDHSGQASWTRSYSYIVRSLAALNRVPLADVELAWETTCENISLCELYNIPEGLHPNSKGYDVLAQVVLAALLKIDIFAEEGALQLEEALALTPGTVVVRPKVVEE